jgi:hypothetical protein
LIVKPGIGSAFVTASPADVIGNRKIGLLHFVLPSAVMPIRAADTRVIKAKVTESFRHRNTSSKSSREAYRTLIGMANPSRLPINSSNRRDPTKQQYGT